MKTAAASRPMVLIQEIRTVWTKRSRGGAAAARRNSVPEAAPLPAPKSSALKIVRQLLLYGEANDFAAPLKSELVESESDSLAVGCVKIEIADERLVVAYEYDDKCGGAPARYGKPGTGLREELIVDRESWARVRYNGRFSGEEWWYEKVVVNVGLFRKTAADVFTSSKPSGEISQMAVLR